MSKQSHTVILPPSMNTASRDALTLQGKLPVNAEIINTSFTPPRRQIQTDTAVWQDVISTEQSSSQAERELWLRR